MLAARVLSGFGLSLGRRGGPGQQGDGKPSNVAHHRSPLRIVEVTGCREYSRVAAAQLTFCFFNPSGPLSQSWALEVFGTPHWCPFHPSKPSILKAQKPVMKSVATMSPSAFRTCGLQTPYPPPP